PPAPRARTRCPRSRARPLSEESRPDADLGRSLFDRDLEVMAHPHRELGQRGAKFHPHVVPDLRGRRPGGAPRPFADGGAPATTPGIAATRPAVAPETTA